MTAIYFIAGMIPLLIATGPGAEERRSIVLFVGGMSQSLLLTLHTVPVIYSILDDCFASPCHRRIANQPQLGARQLIAALCGLP